MLKYMSRWEMNSYVQWWYIYINFNFILCKAQLKIASIGFYGVIKSNY